MKVGVVSPLTGPVAEAGRIQLNSLRLAVDKVNAAGGALGQVVDRGDDMTIVEQPLDEVTTDEAAGTSDQYLHSSCLPCGNVFQSNVQFGTRGCSR